MIWNSIKVELIKAGLIGILALGIGMWVTRTYFPATHEVQLTPDTKVVTVEVPVLTDRIVNKIIKDPADQKLIAKLMKENSDLKAKVIGVSVTTATNEVTGGTKEGGTITVPEAEAIPPATVNGCPSVDDACLKVKLFKDYQLTASYNSEFFSYILNQKFKVVSTTGRNQDGGQFTLVDVYQRTPNGDVKLDAQTQEVVANELVNRLFISPRVNIGVGRLSDTSVGAVAGLQWLKYGRSKAPEDIRFGFATPSIFIKNGGYELGILPISYNVGSIRHMPLITNVWISPFLSQTKFGFVVGAQF